MKAAPRHLEIVGYADRLSASAGDRLEVMVSLEGAATHYTASVIRIRCGDDGPAGPGYKEAPVENPANGRYAGRRQKIHAGSSVLVPASPRLDAPAGFTLQALVWPTLPGEGEQSLLGRWSAQAQAGFVMLLDGEGGLALRLGDGQGMVETVHTGRPLRSRHWYLVAASFDAKTRAVRLLQRPLAGLTRDESGAEHAAGVDLRPVVLAGTPFRMAAHEAGRDGVRLATAGHYNGKLEAPRFARRALTAAEIEALRGEPAASLRAALVGAWDFSREIPTDRILDISGNGLEGRAINLPARAMKGAGWSGEAMNWRERPRDYGAIHFHDDDLYDAGWTADFELPIAREMRSGVYAVKLATETGGEAFVPFFVRPPQGRTTAPVAFLAATATYMAYANSHHGWEDPLSEICYGALLEFGPTELFLKSRPEFGRSTYDLHRDGSGCCWSSRLRPILNLRPKHSLWNFGADLHIVDWLEATGQAYDVITDEDLHREGLALLEPYRCVVTGTHPEYHSLAQIRAIQGYLAGGGRLVYTGGNGFYWRIAWHPTLPGAIEVRRGESGTRTWIAEPGEYYMSATGEYGGLWRASGLSSHRLVGVSYGSEGFDESSYYRRLPGSFDPRAAFIFAGVGAAEKIGDFGLVGGGAAGLELDIADPRLGTPEHALLLASSENHSNVYVMTPEELISAYPGIDGIEERKVRADMVFFETPNGGAVFSTGSIAWAGSLSHNGYDNNVARITGNVLKRFIDPTPL
jgi:N,N-dimethylformamidase beta subunit-like, C-terminal